MGDDRIGRGAQMIAFGNHLKRQYRDRCEYWSHRSLSRLQQPVASGDIIVTAIVDGLDHGKMKFPRSGCLTSKDYSAFVRPHLDLTAILCHGHAAHLVASQPFIAKDSNLTADIVMNLLHVVGLQVDLRQVGFHLQSDNTVRETKNNTTLRLLGIMVAYHKLKYARLDCLQSGHSHEDVDAFLALVANRIQQSKELHNQEQFCSNLGEWLSNKDIRKHEEHRAVHLVSAVRDWKLARCNSSNIFKAVRLAKRVCANYSVLVVRLDPKPRKNFLKIWLHGNNLVGIGGPGAPHSFKLQRRQDAGHLP